MELRHLQALTAISDHGTFSAAASHLGTVQSNVSAHVARLERELGTPMIDRSDGQLTEEGTVVVARARRILAELDALVSDVAACKDEVTGTVRVGMIGTTARWLVPGSWTQWAAVTPTCGSWSWRATPTASSLSWHRDSSTSPWSTSP